MMAGNGTKVNNGSPQTSEAEQLLRDLLAGEEYAVGDRLPSERALAQDYGVSRRSLRRAFELLEAEGAVWRGVGQGTFVGQRQLLSERDVTEVGRLTNPEEVMQARLVLEPALARLAAHRASSEDLEGISHCHEKAATVEGYEAFEHWDERFHTAIARAAGHRLLLNLFLTVNRLRAETSWGNLRKPVMTRDRLDRSADEHGLVVRALLDRDADAADAGARVHLRSIQASLFGHRRDGT